MPFDPSKLKPDNAKAIAIILVVVVVLAIGGYYLSKTFGSIGSILNKVGGVVEGVTDGLGLTTPKPVTDAQAAALAGNMASTNPNSPFSQNLYLSAPSGSIIDPGTNGGTYTTDIAEKIWDAAGFWSTDGQAMLGAIKQLATKAQVSYLTYQFQMVYGKDLYDWLASQLTSNSNVIALQQIINYVNALQQA